jgi:hypothetical protein
VETKRILGSFVNFADITPRIVAMGFPSSGSEGIYRNPIGEVQKYDSSFGGRPLSVILPV